MNITFSHPTKVEIDQVMCIENSGFSIEEAATKKAMLERIANINDTFVIGKKGKEIVGYIVGPASDKRYITDDLFEISVPNSAGFRFLTVLSLVVRPRYQKQGIAGQLLKKFSEIAKKQNREAITLTCLERLIPYYEKYGFVNEGLSSSKHANEKWFNMVLELS